MDARGHLVDAWCEIERQLDLSLLGDLLAGSPAPGRVEARLWCCEADSNRLPSRVEDLDLRKQRLLNRARRLPAQPDCERVAGGGAGRRVPAGQSQCAAEIHIRHTHTVAREIVAQVDQVAAAWRAVRDRPLERVLEGIWNRR